jgi:hypothetical protein
MVLIAITDFIGLTCFVLGYLVGKKQMVEILAGYDPTKSNRSSRSCQLGRGQFNSNGNPGVLFCRLDGPFTGSENIIVFGIFYGHSAVTLRKNCFGESEIYSKIKG